MAVNSGDLITAAQYNGLQSRIEQVLGVGSGDFGYGQSVQSSQVQALTDPDIPDGDLVTSQQMNDLRVDMGKAFQHQNGTEFPIGKINQGSIIGAEFTIDDGTKFEGKGFNDFLSEMTKLENNRLTIDPSQSRVEIKSSDERTTDWNNVIVSEFTVTFGDAEARRHFFNASGEARISGLVDLSTSTGDSYQKDKGWASMIEKPGEFHFGIDYNIITGDGEGVTFPNGGVGDRGLTGSFQTIMRKDAGDDVYGTYSNSYWTIEARNDNNSVIRFRITLVDNDSSGDDEPVTATITFEYGGRTADGAVVLPFPSYSTVSSFE